MVRRRVRVRRWGGFGEVFDERFEVWVVCLAFDGVVLSMYDR